MQKSTVGILTGGGTAGVGTVAARLVGTSLVKKATAASPSAIGGFLIRHPWVGGAVAAGLGVGVLYFTKKKEAIPAAIAAGVVVLAPSVVNSVLNASAIGTLDAATQTAVQNAGLGIAVAERGMRGAPSVELFSAPPQLQLSGASNTPGGSSLSDGYAPVFGGRSF